MQPRGSRDEDSRLERQEEVEQTRRENIHLKITRVGFEEANAVLILGKEGLEGAEGKVDVGGAGGVTELFRDPPE